MVTETQKEEILNHFCDLYEGREEEIACNPLVYGDLLLLAERMAIPVGEVAMVLCNELDKVIKELGW